MATRPHPPRGMRDLLPEEVRTRRLLLERIIGVYERYGFVQIEAPVLEEIDRLLGSQGGENEKLLYKVLRRGLDWPPATEAEAIDLGLRYDLTVPLSRYYATNADQLPSPFKAIHSGPVFRAERPQKGRYRQFNQCDIDIIGESALLAEIELVAATAEALQACEVGEVTFRMNDRRLLTQLVRSCGYDEAQFGRVLIAVDKLDKIGLSGVSEELATLENPRAATMLTETLGALDGVRGVDDTLRELADVVEEAVLEDLQTIARGVAAAAPQVKLEVDATLVRGMGYYTGPIFEIEHAESAGALGGGGRYDQLLKNLSGFDAPAVGMSIGFERLFDLLHGTLKKTAETKRLAVLYPKDANYADVARLCQDARRGGAIVRREASVKNRSAQLARLEAQGFTHWCELRNGELTRQQQLATEDHEKGNS